VAGYTINVLPTAVRHIAKLDRQVRRRIDRAIMALGNNPRPPGATKLGDVDAWRIRVGDWRVIYQIRDSELLVLVIRVGHRRDVYD
jgi:mRNA interferase RelE/StbE